MFLKGGLGLEDTKDVEDVREAISHTKKIQLYFSKDNVFTKNELETEYQSIISNLEQRSNIHFKAEDSGGELIDFYTKEIDNIMVEDVFGVSKVDEDIFFMHLIPKDNKLTKEDVIALSNMLG